MKEDNGYLIIEKVQDFHGFEIIYLEQYKKDVFRVHMKKNLKEYTQFKKVFCKKEFLPIDIDSHNNYWKPN